MSNFGNIAETQFLPPQSDVSVATTKINYLSVYHDYTTLDNWSPVEFIVISSNTIPVPSSNTLANYSFENGSETMSDSSNNKELELYDLKSRSFIAGTGLSCRRLATAGNETLGRGGLPPSHPRFPLRSACLPDGSLPRATKGLLFCTRTCALNRDHDDAPNFSLRCTNEMAVEISVTDSLKVAYTSSQTL